MDFWKDNFDKYIILDDSKKPLHKFNEYKNYFEIENEPNVGILLPEPIIVIDIDDGLDAYHFHQVITNEYSKLNYICVKTKRGYHYYFKSNKSLTNSIKNKNAYGIPIDLKSWGKNSYVIIKSNDSFREIVKECPIEKIDECPIEFLPFTNLKNTNSGIGYNDGDGRRQILFEKITPMIHNKQTKKQIEFVLNNINNYFFKLPVDEKEFKGLFTDDSIFINDDKALFDWYDDRKKFNHKKFALFLNKELNGFTKNQLYWFYENDKYIYNEHNLTVKINEYNMDLKHLQRQEVIKILKTLPVSYHNKVEFNNNVINLKNGLFNLETKEFIKHTSKYFTQCKINTDFDPLSDETEIKKYLNDLFENDQEIINVVEEMLGYFILPEMKFQKAFILIGEGSNGKSFFLKLVNEMLGVDNVSHIGYEKIGDRFYTANLQGKLLNIGEEIPYRKSDEPQIFKKIINGEEVEVERKHQTPFILENKAKLVFTCNKLPPSSDRTFGFMRRWLIIPFNKKFTNENIDYELQKKLFTENNKSALLNLALRGLNRLLKNNNFSKSKKMDQIYQEYYKQVNSICYWIKDCMSDTNWMYSKCLFDLHTKYTSKILTLQKKAVSITNFKDELLWFLPKGSYWKTIKINGESKFILSKPDKREL